MVSLDTVFISNVPREQLRTTRSISVITLWYSAKSCEDEIGMSQVQTICMVTNG